MKILLAAPHVFNPQPKSNYSSEDIKKKDVKKIAVERCINENIARHTERNFIHASKLIDNRYQIITKAIKNSSKHDINVQVYTKNDKTLLEGIEINPGVKLCEAICDKYEDVASYASKKLIMQAENYDIVGYIEDDLLIEDSEFFEKIMYLNSIAGNQYVFLPHRIEQIKYEGEVILSGDPEGGRKDLFWDTGETITIPWPLGEKTFYRSTNPHSGCYFLTKEQALILKHFWQSKNWRPDFQLSGPLEQAASGMLLPVFKVMKPIPNDYSYLKIKHLDQIWKNHKVNIRRATFT